MSLLADILFKEQRRRVLGLLLLNPERSYHVREIARLTGTTAGTIHRELKKLAEAGILSTSKLGNQVHYKANQGCPVYMELASLLRKTSGLADVVRGALMVLVDDIEAAFIFGSMASGGAGNYSDVDLCVIGRVPFGEVVKALYDCHQVLGREINPKRFSVDEWQQAVRDNTVFVQELLTAPAINLIGNRDDLINDTR
jgi:DNA-binding transcriptional ArsR family regulator